MVEVPVDTLKRIGRSKVSGTVRGVVGAAVWYIQKNYQLVVACCYSTFIP